MMRVGPKHFMLFVCGFVRDPHRAVLRCLARRVLALSREVWNHVLVLVVEPVTAAGTCLVLVYGVSRCG